MADPRRAADRSRIDAAEAAQAASVVAAREKRGGGKYDRHAMGSIGGAPDLAIHEVVGARRGRGGRRELFYAAVAEVRYVSAGRTWARTRVIAGELPGGDMDWTDVTEPV